MLFQVNQSANGLPPERTRHGAGRGKRIRRAMRITSCQSCNAIMAVHNHSSYQEVKDCLRTSRPTGNSRPAVLLCEGWREGHRTRKRTLANPTDWPAAQVEALRAVLKGDYQRLAPADGFSIE